MNRRLPASALVILAAVLAVPVSGQEKAAIVKWEYKAVGFLNLEKEDTKRLNELAAEGWEYVGPLANGEVAFRRPFVPREQIVVEAAGPQPRTPAPGEKVAIVVTVRSGDRRPLAGATVSVAAGGGNFLTEAGKPIDPKNRGTHPNSVRGTTDGKGQFTTWWVANTGPGAYVLGIEAVKQDYNRGRAEYSIRVTP
jgi:hypothetical protein